MIYDREKIGIPILCPIQFVEPVGYSIYKQQTDYAPLLKTGNLKLCVLISEDIYLAESNLSIKMLSEIGVVLKTVNFTKKQLSNDYFFATATIDEFSEAGYDALVYFEIYSGTTLLANSLYYMANPTVDKYVKTLKYTHNVNEWDCIFKEDTDTLNIPFYADFSDYFTKCELSITETKYILSFTLYVPEDPMQILSPFDFDIYFNDIVLGNIHTVEANVLGTESVFTVEVDREILEGSEINIICMTKEENYVFIDTEFMLFGSSFTSQNEYVIDVECGVIPKDLRDEQEIEDFIQQDMVNETIYGETYGVKSYTFGDSKGIPFWLAQKINRASLCDDFYIDNERHLRIKGSKMEKVDDTENGLAVYKIDFQTENTYLQ